MSDLLIGFETECERSVTTNQVIKANGWIILSLSSQFRSIVQCCKKNVRKTSSRWRCFFICIFRSNRRCRLPRTFLSSLPLFSLFNLPLYFAVCFDQFRAILCSTLHKKCLHMKPLAAVAFWLRNSKLLFRKSEQKFPSGMFPLVSLNFSFLMNCTATLSRFPTHYLSKNSNLRLIEHKSRSLVPFFEKIFSILRLCS